MMLADKCSSDQLVVVSGISGRFAECFNIKEFREKILNGENLVTHDEERWPKDTLNLPTGSAKVRRIEEFDAQYFGYTDEQADLMDPMDRLIITEAHSAILDAGILPETLRGSNTGFFFGSFVDEVQSALKDEFDTKGDIYQYHASRAMEALDLRGPCIFLENACSTSMTCLQIAVNSIESGLCDQAIVGACNITHDPTKVDWMVFFDTMSPDSTCHVFDKAANGYVKGEAAVAVFLQRKPQAKRIYAEVLGIHLNADGYKSVGFTHPGWRTQRDLIMQAMSKAQVNGKQFRYFELHGTGTQAGDKVECRSIYEAICKDRDKNCGPLMIGSVKSITGHTEGASGLVSLAKVIIAYQCKLMAPNLHYHYPNPNIPQLTDGTYYVPIQAAPFEGGVCGINNFAIGGSNGCVVLNSFDPEQCKNCDIEQDFDICQPIPRLIFAFSRNQKLVSETLDKIESNLPRITKGYLSLLNDISSISPERGMNSRGYMIVVDKQCTHKSTNDVLLSQTGTGTDHKIRRPLWLIFSGLGCQWSSMARQFMPIETFATSVLYSIKFLTALGYDCDALQQFIITGTPVEPANREPVCVSIVVIQIALVDTLRHLGLGQVDGIVGHSIGEVAAAYADGCITHDEALHIAFTIEHVVFTIRDRISSSMIAVGVSSEEAYAKYCFGTIDVACHNTANMITMAGNETDMHKLMQLLSEQSKNGLFVRPLATNGVMAHTKFMRISFRYLIKQEFAKLRIRPKSRSAAFISTSYTPDQWLSEQCICPGGEYFGHNICNPVLFYEAIRNAPPHTVFLEIGPTDQLRAPILRTFAKEHNVQYQPMMRREYSDNLTLFLCSLGTLYTTAGQNLNLNRLYGPVAYPVLRHTEFLSPIFTYDHSKPRMVIKYPQYFCAKNKSRSIYEETVSLNDPTHEYLADHSVDGLVLYPGTGYLVLAWKMLAAYFDAKDYLQFAVHYRHVKFIRATKLSASGVNFKCIYLAETGAFAIEANGTVCCTGFIYPLKEAVDHELSQVGEIENKEDTLFLDNEAFYRELHVRGYHFGKTFKNVLVISDDSSQAVVRWTGNVITYLDSILQSGVLREAQSRLLFVPTYVEELKLNPLTMMRKLRHCARLQELVADVHLDHQLRLVHSAGVKLTNLAYKPIARKVDELSSNSEVVVESQELIGYSEENAIDQETQNSIEQYLSKIQDFLSSQSYDPVNDDSTTNGLLLAHVNRKDTLHSMSSFACQLDCDQLHSTIISDRFFRSQLDVVIENINLYTKFNVLEINTSQQIIYPKLSSIITRPLFGFNMANLIYTVAHSDAASLPKEIIKNKTLQWKTFDVNKCLVPYRELSVTQEFVIYRDAHISLHQLDQQLDYHLLLQSISLTLTDHGFLLAFLRVALHPHEQSFVDSSKYNTEWCQHQVQQFISFAEDAGLTFVGKKLDTYTCCSILFRKMPSEVNQEQESTIQIDNDNLDWLEKLKTANRNANITCIWLHTSEPLSGIVGLVRALAKDVSKQKIKYIFHDTKHIRFERALEIARSMGLLQNVFIGKELGSYRHLTFSESSTLMNDVEEFELRQIKTGELSSFRPFVKQPLPPVPSTNHYGSNNEFPKLGPIDNEQMGDMEVVIYKAPLNFRDVMIASARMSPAAVSDRMAWDDVVLGIEFAGRLRSTGQMVMGFSSGKCKAFSSSIVVNQDRLWYIPSHWSMLQASTVPLAYATSYYALVMRAKLCANETVLIHSGAGAVGLAAIQICLAMKCRVLTTANIEKHQFLLRNFPQLDPNCIGNSRDCSFYNMVMQQTAGKGVDVVLNSLTGDMFWTSLRCLAPFGRFCEIGKYQLMEDGGMMDASNLLGNKTFHGVHLDRLFPEDESEMSVKARRERQQLWSLIEEGIDSGVIKPLPYTAFSMDECEKAFRYMASGKHIGKVVVKFRPQEELNIVKEMAKLKMKAIATTYFDPIKSYIIAGGLGGMGLELMWWMQERGATKFVLTSRSGIKTATHKFMIKLIRARGCTVVVNTDDAGCMQGAQALLTQAHQLGPIGGIFLSTLVLANETLDRITEDMFRKVMYAKSTQALVIDQALRQHYDHPVDYFVGFSSIASGRGFNGQSNYAFANSILERVCEQRRRDGLHGLAIQWGMIGDVGYVADNMDVKESLRGYKPQPIISCWQQLDRCLQTKHYVCGSFIRVKDKHTSTLGEDGTEMKLSLLDQVCTLMGIRDKSKLNPKTTLADLGLDSMMATEIGNIFENEFHVAMHAKDIRALTVEKISQAQFS